jgi:hypothetical protein
MEIKGEQAEDSNSGQVTHLEIKEEQAEDSNSGTAPELEPGTPKPTQATLSNHPFFLTPVLEIKKTAVREASSDLGISVRTLMVEFAKIDVERAMGMLALWEAEPYRPFQIFYFTRVPLVSLCSTCQREKV